MNAPEDVRFARVGLAVVAAGWAVAIAAAPLAYSPPSSDTHFDTERAHETLRRIVGNQAPRPTGSDGNARGRARIVAILREMGLEPEVTDASICGQRYRFCSTPRNVIARIDGRGEDAVVLTAHYDSVRGGPGVSDDGAGVAAVLEVARVLASEGPFENDIVFLIDDAEESGLLGAEQFVRDDPSWEHVRLVVNVEARGVSGPSVFFESGVPNGLAVDAFAESPKPIGNSLAATIYALLPNDTDFTIYREAGRTGLNFAYIGEAQHYHTRRDDLDHLEVASMRHHGEHSLAVMRFLANEDLSSDRPQLVFFDFYSLVVVRYSETIARVLAVLVLLLALGSLGWGVHEQGLSLGPAGTGVLHTIGPPSLSGAIGFGLAHACSALGVPMQNWIGAGELLLVGAGCVGISSVVLARAIARGADARSLGAGVLVGWSIGALALAFLAPGTSFLISLPAALGAIAAFVPRLHRYTPIALGLGAAALIPPLVYFLYDALATVSAMPAALLVSYGWTATLPLWPTGKRGMLVTAAIFALGVALAIGWALLAR